MNFKILSLIILVFIFLFLLLNPKKNNLEFFNVCENTIVDVDENDKKLKEFNKYKKLKEEIDKKAGANFFSELKEDDLKEYKNEGTYKRVPLPLNSILLGEVVDEGILKNYRTNSDLNTYSQEIFFNEINEIIDKIVYERSYLIKFNKIINNEGNLLKNKLHKIIANNFVENVNKFYKELDFNHNKHKYDKRIYKLLKYEIIEDQEIEDLTIDNRNLIMNVKIYKENKDFHYSLQINCNYNFINKTINYNQIDIIGIIEQEKILFPDSFLNNNSKNDYCRVDTKNNGDFKTCFRDDIDSTKSLDEYERDFQEKELPKYLYNKKYEEGFHKDYLKYKCFLKKGFNESTCKAYSNDNGTIGVYDKPCNTDDECPFYKKNLNYENSRGGCINGYCEMPVNIERVGYKNYRKRSNPFCHNCNRKNCLGEECYDCCDEQKNNQDLKSPDYMFSNDMIERNLNS